MTDVVVDASAILAFLQREPGSSIVAAAVEQGTCFVSAVNVAEVLAKLTDSGMTLEECWVSVRDIELETVAFDAAAAVATAALRSSTRAAGLSLGDRACIALAQSLELPVVTTDRAWRAVPLPVEIIFARP
ncbi:MAG: type II toxin-antitoxin system VapC family toxin [Dehalococcoidia bacterium]